jgi:galactofuranose transport system substrate-binding protein
MRQLSSKDSLVFLAALVLVFLVAACAPGSKTADQGSGGAASGASAQQKFLPSHGPYCQGQKSDKSFGSMVVGFSQSEQETNPFRSTESDSIRSAAKQNGVKLLYANAQSQEPKQISDIRDLLSRGADALIVAPLLGSGLQSAFTAADNANVPVILIDRQTAGTPCKDYITNIESNFIRQGQIAAQEIAKLTNNNAKIAVLEGTPGASVTNDRTKGFEDAIKGKSGMQIVASQTGNFVRADGQQVMEQIIQANPDINAVYAQNDEMAIGAITALKSAGKNPGQDVKIIGIDGTQDAAKAILTGDLNATVTTNPRFGPKAFEVLKSYLAGEKVPQNIRVKDELVTKNNAQQYLKSGAY